MGVNLLFRVNFIIHSKYEKCRDGAYFLAKIIKNHYSDILGPAVPGIGRIRGLYQFSIIVKIEKSGPNLIHVKKKIKESIEKTSGTAGFGSLRIHIDVDPY